MDNMVTIIVAIIGSGVLNTLLNAVITAKNEKKKSENGLLEALRLLFKDRLKYLCDFYVSQGWIYSDELDDLIAMHKCYHYTLNGNGFLDERMARVKALEVRGIGIH